MSRYTDHARFKLETLRHLGVTPEAVEATLSNPTDSLYDAETDRFIAADARSDSPSSTSAQTSTPWW